MGHVCPRLARWAMFWTTHSMIWRRTRRKWCDKCTNVDHSRLIRHAIEFLGSVNMREARRSFRKHKEALRHADKHEQWLRSSTSGDARGMARRVHTELREHIYSTWRFLNPRVWSNGKTLAIMSRDPWFDSGCAHFCLLFCSVCVFCQCCSTILCCFWVSGKLIVFIVLIMLIEWDVLIYWWERPISLVRSCQRWIVASVMSLTEIWPRHAHDFGVSDTMSAARNCCCGHSDVYRRGTLPSILDQFACTYPAVIKNKI